MKGWTFFFTVRFFSEEERESMDTKGMKNKGGSLPLLNHQLKSSDVTRHL